MSKPFSFPHGVSTGDWPLSTKEVQRLVMDYAEITNGEIKVSMNKPREFWIGIEGDPNKPNKNHRYVYLADPVRIPSEEIIHVREVLPGDELMLIWAHDKKTMDALRAENERLKATLKIYEVCIEKEIKRCGDWSAGREALHQGRKVLEEK